MKNENDFISQLVDETYHDAQMHESDNVVSIEDYFNQRSEVCELSLSPAEIKITSFKTMYRFEFGTRVMDVPRNWSIFQTLEYDCSYQLDKLNQGSEFLLDVFESFLETKLEVLFVESFRGKLQISFTKEEIEIKKAA